MSRKHGWNHVGDATPSPLVDGLRAVREPNWGSATRTSSSPGAGCRFAVCPGHTPDDHDGPATRIRLRRNAP